MPPGSDGNIPRGLGNPFFLSYQKHRWHLSKSPSVDGLSFMGILSPVSANFYDFEIFFTHVLARRFALDMGKRNIVFRHGTFRDCLLCKQCIFPCHPRCLVVATSFIPGYAASNPSFLLR